MSLRYWNKLVLLMIVLSLVVVASPNLSHAEEGSEQRIVGIETAQGDEIIYNNPILGVELSDRPQIN